MEDLGSRSNEIGKRTNMAGKVLFALRVADLVSLPVQHQDSGSV